jgi:hypothetical protein
MDYVTNRIVASWLVTRCMLSMESATNPTGQFRFVTQCRFEGSP